MNPIDCRTFLAGLAGSFVLVSAESLRSGALLTAPQYGTAPVKPTIGAASDACWLDVAAALMNIEFEEEHTDAPTIQLFGPSGLLAEKKVGDFPPLACRHLLVSELFPQVESDPGNPLTVRMLAPNAMMVVSALHIDYERRDIALEHGSDRHSTFQDFKC